MSASATRREKIVHPSGCFRFTVMLRLLRCRFWKSGPWRAPQPFAFQELYRLLDHQRFCAPVGQLSNSGRARPYARQIQYLNP